MLGDQRGYDVLAIDDIDVVRDGLIALQHSHPDVVRSIRVVGHPSEVDYESTPPDVVVLDFWIERDRKPVTRYIADLRAWCDAVILYTSEQRTGALRDAVRAGIDGLCLKADGREQLAAGIRQVGGGGKAVSGPLARAIWAESEMEHLLTPRQQEVLAALALGLTYDEIAQRLVITPKTVESHVDAIFSLYKTLLGAEEMNRNKVLREALRRGHVSDPWREDGE